MKHNRKIIGLGLIFGSQPLFYFHYLQFFHVVRTIDNFTIMNILTSLYVLVNPTYTWNLIAHYPGIAMIIIGLLIAFTKKKIFF